MTYTVYTYNLMGNGRLMPLYNPPISLQLLSSSFLNAFVVFDPTTNFGMLRTTLFHALITLIIGIIGRKLSCTEV